MPNDNSNLQEFLLRLVRMPDGASITKVGSVLNETRCGSYYRIRSGLATSVWFLGHALDQLGAPIIAEYVND